ncbi:unnamed protein product [Amoebophrya sp. A25]|nr:unnamed protein product [Amoebophrya sp. A25]|eukprot:GSA25T00005281001.1
MAIQHDPLNRVTKSKTFYPRLNRNENYGSIHGKVVRFSTLTHNDQQDQQLQRDRVDGDDDSMMKSDSSISYSFSFGGVDEEMATHSLELDHVHAAIKGDAAAEARIKSATAGIRRGTRPSPARRYPFVQGSTTMIEGRHKNMDPRAPGKPSSSSSSSSSKEPQEEITESERAEFREQRRRLLQMYKQLERQQRAVAGHAREQRLVSGILAQPWAATCGIAAHQMAMPSRQPDQTENDPEDENGGINPDTRDTVFQLVVLEAWDYEADLTASGKLPYSCPRFDGRERLATTDVITSLLPFQAVPVAIVTYREHPLREYYDAHQQMRSVGDRGITGLYNFDTFPQPETSATSRGRPVPLLGGFHAPSVPTLLHGHRGGFGATAGRGMLFYSESQDDEAADAFVDPDSAVAVPRRRGGIEPLNFTHVQPQGNALGGALHRRAHPVTGALADNQFLRLGKIGGLVPLSVFSSSSTSFQTLSTKHHCSEVKHLRQRPNQMKAASRSSGKSSRKRAHSANPNSSKKRRISQINQARQHGPFLFYANSSDSAQQADLQEGANGREDVQPGIIRRPSAAIGDTKQTTTGGPLCEKRSPIDLLHAPSRYFGEKSRAIREELAETARKRAESAPPPRADEEEERFPGDRKNAGSLSPDRLKPKTPGMKKLEDAALLRGILGPGERSAEMLAGSADPQAIASVQKVLAELLEADGGSATLFALLCDTNFGEYIGSRKWEQLRDTVTDTMRVLFEEKGLAALQRCLASVIIARSEEEARELEILSDSFLEYRESFDGRVPRSTTRTTRSITSRSSEPASRSAYLKKRAKASDSAFAARADQGPAITKKEAMKSKTSQKSKKASARTTPAPALSTQNTAAGDASGASKNPSIQKPDGLRLVTLNPKHNVVAQAGGMPTSTNTTPVPPSPSATPQMDISAEQESNNYVRICALGPLNDDARNNDGEHREEAMSVASFPPSVVPSAQSREASVPPIPETDFQEKIISTKSSEVSRGGGYLLGEKSPPQPKRPAANSRSDPTSTTTGMNVPLPLPSSSAQGMGNNLLKDEVVGPPDPPDPTTDPAYVDLLAEEELQTSGLSEREMRLRSPDVGDDKGVDPTNIVVKLKPKPSPTARPSIANAFLASPEERENLVYYRHDKLDQHPQQQQGSSQKNTIFLAPSSSPTSGAAGDTNQSSWVRPPAVATARVAALAKNLDLSVEESVKNSGLRSGASSSHPPPSGASGGTTGKLPQDLDDSVVSSLRGRSREEKYLPHTSSVEQQHPASRAGSTRHEYPDLSAREYGSGTSARSSGPGAPPSSDWQIQIGEYYVDEVAEPDEADEKKATCSATNSSRQNGVTGADGRLVVAGGSKENLQQNAAAGGTNLVRRGEGSVSAGAGEIARRFGSATLYLNTSGGDTISSGDEDSASFLASPPPQRNMKMRSTSSSRSHFPTWHSNEIKSPRGDAPAQGKLPAPRAARSSPFRLGDDSADEALSTSILSRNRSRDHPRSGEQDDADIEQTASVRADQHVLQLASSPSSKSRTSSKLASIDKSRADQRMPGVQEGRGTATSTSHWNYRKNQDELELFGDESEYYNLHLANYNVVKTSSSAERSYSTRRGPSVLVGPGPSTSYAPPSRQTQSTRQVGESISATIKSSVDAGGRTESRQAITAARSSAAASSVASTNTRAFSLSSTSGGANRPSLANRPSTGAATDAAATQSGASATSAVVPEQKLYTREATKTSTTTRSEYAGHGVENQPPVGGMTTSTSSRTSITVLATSNIQSKADAPGDSAGGGQMYSESSLKTASKTTKKSKKKGVAPDETYRGRNEDDDARSQRQATTSSSSRRKSTMEEIPFLVDHRDDLQSSSLSGSSSKTSTISTDVVRNRHFDALQRHMLNGSGSSVALQTSTAGSISKDSHLNLMSTSSKASSGDVCLVPSFSSASSTVPETTTSKTKKKRVGAGRASKKKPGPAAKQAKIENKVTADGQHRHSEPSSSKEIMTSARKTDMIQPAPGTKTEEDKRRASFAMALLSDVKKTGKGASATTL